MADQVHVVLVRMAHGAPGALIGKSERGEPNALAPRCSTYDRVDTRYGKQINPQTYICQCSLHPVVFQGIEFPWQTRSELE